MQNKAACFVLKPLRPDRMTPLLRELHWLPCHLRINFRILMYVFKCINNLTPAYLMDLLTIYKPRRTLCSSADQSILAIHTARKKVGEQAVSHLGSKLWNQLPLIIMNSPSHCF